jgi:hypothetical protein
MMMKSDHQRRQMIVSGSGITFDDPRHDQMTQATRSMENPG